MIESAGCEGMVYIRACKFLFCDQMMRLDQTIHLAIETIISQEHGISIHPNRCDSAYSLNKMVARLYRFFRVEFDFTRDSTAAGFTLESELFDSSQRKRNDLTAKCVEACLCYFSLISRQRLFIFLCQPAPAASQY